MKISKQRLIEIIKEEVELAEKENPQATDADDGKALGEFSSKFLELSKRIRSVRGLDPKEMTLILNLLTDLIKYSANSSATPILKAIDSIASKRMGTE